MPTLPVLQPTIRRSKSSKRRAAVLIAVQLLIAAHITHWLVTGRSITPVEPSEAMALARDGVVNAGLVFFGVTIGLTAVFGRFFCGWACHLVALQDYCRWLLQKIGIRPRPLNSRLLRLVPFVAFFYMFLWPAVYRLWADEPIDSLQWEWTTESFWATFPGWVIGGLTFFICGFVIVYLLGAKGFCTYACPYGAVFGVVDRVAKLRIRVTDACEGCGHCTAVCTSNVRVHEEVRQFGMVVDDGCMKCLDCVSVCPNDALYYGRGPARRAAIAVGGPRPRKTPAPGWAEEIVLGLAFALAFFSFRSLYGLVPFLMALGWSAVLAYLVLLTVRLWRRPNVSLRRWVLKSAGRLRPAGIVFLSGALVLAAFWAHSATVRVEQVQGERLYDRTADLRLDAYAFSTEPPAIDRADLALARHGIAHLERVRDWGLVPTVGNAAHLAWFYFLSGAPIELEAAAEDAIERGEYPGFMHHLLAMQSLWSGDTDRALVELDLAIAADPGRGEPRLNRGLLLAAIGRLNEAERAFEDAGRIMPDSPEPPYNAGVAMALQGDAQGAIDHFRQALERDPGHLEARENLAGMLASIGEYEASEQQYRQAIEQSPSDPETRLLLARVLTALGDLEGALEQLDSCLALEPGKREAIILRANIESRMTER